jgi:hypothetical protein
MGTGLTCGFGLFTKDGGNPPELKGASLTSSVTKPSKKGNSTACGREQV